MALTALLPLARTFLTHTSTHSLRPLQIFNPSLPFGLKHFTRAAAAVSLPRIFHKHRIYSTIATGGDTGAPTDTHSKIQKETHGQTVKDADTESENDTQTAEAGDRTQAGTKINDKTLEEGTDTQNETVIPTEQPRKKRSYTKRDSNPPSLENGDDLAKQKSAVQKDKRTSKKPAKDEDAGPKPLSNPYFVLVREKRAQVVEEVRGENIGGSKVPMEVGRRLGAMWKQLTEEEKEAYRASYHQQRQLEVGKNPTVSAKNHRRPRLVLDPSLPTLPKRPPTAFLRYMVERWPVVGEKLKVELDRPRVPMKMIMPVLGHEWRLMYSPQQSVYRNKYVAAYESFRQELVEWKKKVGFSEEQAAIPKFRTGWVHFFHSEGARLKAENPEIDVAERNHALKEQWINMSPEEKQEYSRQGAFYGKEDSA